MSEPESWSKGAALWWHKRTKRLLKGKAAVARCVSPLEIFTGWLDEVKVQNWAVVGSLILISQYCVHSMQ